MFTPTKAPGSGGGSESRRAGVVGVGSTIGTANTVAASVTADARPAARSLATSLRLDPHGHIRSGSINEFGSEPGRYPSPLPLGPSKPSLSDPIGLLDRLAMHRTRAASGSATIPTGLDQAPAGAPIVRGYRWNVLR